MARDFSQTLAAIILGQATETSAHLVLLGVHKPITDASVISSEKRGR